MVERMRGDEGQHFWLWFRAAQLGEDIDIKLPTQLHSAAQGLTRAKIMRRRLGTLAINGLLTVFP